MGVIGAKCVSKEKCIITGQTKEQHFKIEAFVVKNLSHHVILGHPFLKENQGVLDYGISSVSFGVHKRETFCWRETNSNKTCPDELKKSLTELAGNEITGTLLRFWDRFDGTTGRTKTIQHEIRLKSEDQKPIKQQAYPYTQDKMVRIQKLLHEMEEDGVIEPSKSPWASPIVIVSKKNGSDRFCVDYRKLNAVTISDAYPMPNLHEKLRKVGGAKIFTTLDMKNGYWQVEMSQDAREKTAFTTPRGLFQFIVMPYGLRNSPATFQRLSEEVLRGFIDEFVQVYLDDIIIYSDTIEQHNVHLTRV
jgi:hypothetical protein